jgi:hypothetical protein
MLGGFGNS